MIRILSSSRLIAIAVVVLASAASQANAQSSVAITGPANNASYAKGSSILVTGTCSADVYSLKVVISGTAVSTRVTPNNGVWTATITAPSTISSWAIQATGYNFPQGALVATDLLPSRHIS